MRFQDVAKFLFDRAVRDEKRDIKTQADYALWCGVPRPQFNQILEGKVAPSLYIEKILNAEGHRLEDVIDLPDMQAERSPYLIRVEQLLARHDIGDFIRWMIEDLGKRVDAIPRPVPAAKKKKSKKKKVRGDPPDTKAG